MYSVIDKTTLPSLSPQVYSWSSSRSWVSAALSAVSASEAVSDEGQAELELEANLCPVVHLCSRRSCSLQALHSVCCCGNERKMGKKGLTDARLARQHRRHTAAVRARHGRRRGDDAASGGGGAAGLWRYGDGTGLADETRRARLDVTGRGFA